MPRSGSPISGGYLPDKAATCHWSNKNIRRVSYAVIQRLSKGKTLLPPYCLGAGEILITVPYPYHQRWSLNVNKSFGLTIAKGRKWKYMVLLPTSYSFVGTSIHLLGPGTWACSSARRDKSSPTILTFWIACDKDFPRHLLSPTNGLDC